MTMWQFHDRWLLWSVQQGFYRYDWVSVAVMVCLLMGLPTHRRLARAVAWVAVGWSLLCLVCYGALWNAPMLGWTMVVCLAYRACRALVWPTQANHNDADIRWKWIPLKYRPRASWTSCLVRRYLKADPSNVYWLDLARSVRGIPLVRTAGERRSLALSDGELSAWSRGIWRVFFAIIEWRIWIYQRLPDYFHRPHAALNLGEIHLRVLLESEIESAKAAMLDGYTAASFAEYRKRTSDPQVLLEHERLAGVQGQRWCRLRLALAEYVSFRQPWRQGEDGLLDAMNLCFETWRVRCQYDHLWFTDGAALAATAVKPPTNPHAKIVQADEQVPSAAPRQEPVAAADFEFPGDGQAQLVAADAVDDDFLRDEPLAAWSGAEEAVQPVATATMPTPAGPTVAEVVAPATDDDEFFAQVDKPLPEVEPEVKTEPAVIRTPRDAARLADLQQACSLLEAYLGLESQPRFATQVRSVERMLDQTTLLVPVTQLLMLYLLRSDHAGANVEAEKVELLARLWNRFRDSRVGQNAHRIFVTMYVDLLFQHGEYSNVRALFGAREPHNDYEWKILADAQANIANHLRGQPSLRDVQLREAIAAYFQAGFRGIWTPCCTRLLIGTHTARETIAVLDQHPVELAEPDRTTIIPGDRGLDPQHVVQDPARAAVAPRTPPAPPIATAPMAFPAATPQPPRVATPDPAVAVRPTHVALPPPAATAPPLLIVELEIVDSLLRGRVSIKSYPRTCGSQTKQAGHASVPDPSMAPMHCRFVLEQNSPVIEDLSGGKMLLNGLAVRRAVLEDGDRIRMGQTTFQVSLKR